MLNPYPAVMFAQIAIVGLVGVVAWVYQAIKPPPPKICGSRNGPPVTATRVKLRDGRYLAYKELGVPKERAKHKLIYVHGFDQSRDDALPVTMVGFFSLFFSLCSSPVFLFLFFADDKGEPSEFLRHAEY